MAMVTATTRECWCSSRGGAPLTREDFHAVYAAELAQGKFWGVEHDLRVLRGAGLRAEGAAPFSAHFDYVWFTTASLRLAGAQPPLPAREHAREITRGLVSRA